MNKLKSLLWVLIVLVTVYNASAAFNVSNGLQSWYSFDNAQTIGSRTIDLNGVQNGSIHLANTGVTGKLGEAYSYQIGVNAWTNITYIGLLGNNSKDFTIAYWFRQNSTSFTNGNEDTIAKTGWSAYRGGIARCVGGSCTHVCRDTYPQYNSGDWILRIYVRSGANNWQIWSGNSTDLIRHCNSAGQFDNGDDPFGIGGIPSAAIYSESVIDEFAIWNYTLSNTSISFLWNSGTGRNYTNATGSGGGGKSITVSYDTPIYETDKSNITITFKNYNATNASTAMLLYNNTNTPLIYPGILNYTNANLFSFKYEITAPYVNLDGYPLNFSWNYTLRYSNGTNTTAQTSNYTQTILWNNYTLNLYARDITTHDIINDFNVTVNGSAYTGTVNTSTGGISIILKKGNYTLEYNARGYAARNSSVFVKQPSATKTVYLIRYYYFNLVDEKTGAPFQINTTSSITLNVYCNNETITYDFNTTSATIPINCTFSYLKLDVNYANSTYFRTLVPDTYNVTWFLADATIYSVVQTLLTINDLTGDYSDGILKIEKVIPGHGLSTIIKQYFDVEAKVILYLIQYNSYTVSIINNDGLERTLGVLIPESASEKTITYPPISFYPTDTRYENNITWSIATNWTAGRTQFIYNDTTGGTSQVTFNVYNSTGGLLFASSSAASNWVSTYNALNINTSYILVMNATFNNGLDAIHEKYGIGNQQTIINDAVFDGWTPTEAGNITKWIGFILLTVLGLVFGALESYYGVVITVIFVYITYLLGVTIWSSFLMAALGVLAFFEWWRKSKER